MYSLFLLGHPGYSGPVSSFRPSSATKRAALRALLFEGHQSAKVVVDPQLLGGPEEHGFPLTVLERFAEGVPLDLNPRWPLELDLDGDPRAMSVSLSFQGRVYRCRVPWCAITVIGVGFGGIHWEHEDEEALGVAAPAPEPQAADDKAGHLRVVK